VGSERNPNRYEGEMDVRQIKDNRRTVEESSLESSINEEAAACDADWPDAVFNGLPEDRIGLVPCLKEESNRRT
jgi:hypothetical protein